MQVGTNRAVKQWTWGVAMAAAVLGAPAYGADPEAIMDGLKGNPLVTIHVYSEMDHAFAREGGQHYDKANADLANTRTDNFFRQHLG